MRSRWRGRLLVRWRRGRVSWGANRETLRTWVRAADRAESEAGTGGRSAERELRRLRERVAELDNEREIRPKAAACFAEMGR